MDIRAKREPLSHPKKRIDPSFTRIYPKHMKVSAQYAQEHLPDLLTAASSGEEVEIALPGKPALFLAPRPTESLPVPPRRPRAELLYAWEGKITLPTADEWRTMDKELEDEMLNGPVFPPDYA